ncbi:MAG: hypothetical protein JSR86_07755 [Proteobacteria bacterium]|nr:hypothetical protein [Pseudomonadota bacterium]
MKTAGAVTRRPALQAVSLAASIANAPPATGEQAPKGAHGLMRLGLALAVLGLVAAPLVALAVR